MRELKNLAAVAVILLLLPYIMAVFSGNLGGSEKGAETAFGGEYKICVDNGNTVEWLDLETYAMGAAAAVLEAGCEEEMIKAQLILVRTNLVREIQAQQAEMSDGTENGSIDEISDTREIKAETLTETYMNAEVVQRKMGREFDTFWNILLKAAEETKGMILTYDGDPVEAAYHSVSNGKTRTAADVLREDLPYLVSVECPKDVQSEDYFFRKEITKEEWKAVPKDVGMATEIAAEITERDSAGYVKTVVLNGQSMTGEAFRSLFQLNSADFSVSESENTIIITTKGFGHGLGMSQYYANYLAGQGKTYEEILSCFFSGTELQKSE